MLTKSRLLDVFSKYNFMPLKRLGGNYLIDGNIRDKIIRECRLSKSDSVLEIGPGLGALTMDLAASGARVFAVEIDKKAYAILNELAGGDYPNLKIFNKDILKFDLEKIAQGGRIKVAGNIPYYITTPIIEYLINNRHLLESAVIMVQKEVANRLLAGPGEKDYGSVSCFVRYFTRPEYIYTVKRASFFPMPDVDSSILRLTFLDKPSVSVNDEEKFFRIVRGSFNQRRKSIINSLARVEVLDMPKEKLSAILKSVGIASSARPETLGMIQFAAISNAISQSPD
ncbi:MAG: 16S rRNA (adenine(1518)-N(6)/adenine(1519)-N(6))-dimethyltransferase RsmA [Candidatus Omnitrophota bacterium]